MAAFRYHSVAWQLIYQDEPPDNRKIKIVLVGGPLDGQRRFAPAGFLGVCCHRVKRNGELDWGREWWYRRTEERSRTGRLICRYGQPAPRPSLPHEGGGC